MVDNNGGTQQLSRVSRIEEKIDRQTIGETEISSTSGGMSFRNMLEVMEFAKLMAISDVAVPIHLRGNVGACLAICIQAVEWRMSPYAVANKSYVVNNRISYESQLIHAVIEQRAPLVGRLRCSYSGIGDSRKCKVWATLKGEDAPFEYESPPFRDIQPKNSPLWKTKPDLQLFYNTSRDWGRMYVPDVILGVYAEDELQTSLIASRQAVPMPRAIGEAPAMTDPNAQPISTDDASQLPESELKAKPQMTDAEAERILAEKSPSAQKPQPPAGTYPTISNPVSDKPMPDLSTWEKFLNAVQEIAMRDNISPETCASGLNKAVVALGKKGKEKEIGLQWRNDCLAVMEAGKFDWNTGRPS